MKKRFVRLLLFFGLIAVLLGNSSLIKPASADSAEAAFRQAYANRYTWDEPFPGYRAEVSVRYYNDLEQGVVQVNPDLSVEVSNIDNEEVRQFIENQLRMEVIHRRQLPFEKLHAQNRFELEETDDKGTLVIREVGDEMDSYYRLRDGIISQVNRRFGDVAVTVDTIGTTRTPEGYLVVQFQTTYRNAETGEVLEREDVRDFHQKIGNYYFLTSRDIRYAEKGDPADKPSSDIRIDFNNFQRINRV